MISLNNIRLQFADKPVFTSLTWTFPDTGLFLLTGANGAGKTTLLNLLTTTLVPDAGEITFTNEAQDYFIVPHEPFFYDYLTGGEFLDLILKTRHAFDRLPAAQQLCVQTNLANALDYQIITYSLGMRKKLILIAGLLSGAKTIFLDEALNGVDVEATGILMAQMLQTSRTSLIILISHETELRPYPYTGILSLQNGQLQQLPT